MRKYTSVALLATLALVPQIASAKMREIEREQMKRRSANVQPTIVTQPVTTQPVNDQQRLVARSANVQPTNPSQNTGKPDVKDVKPEPKKGLWRRFRDFIRL